MEIIIYWSILDIMEATLGRPQVLDYEVSHVNVITYIEHYRTFLSKDNVVVV